MYIKKHECFHDFAGEAAIGTLVILKLTNKYHIMIILFTVQDIVEAVKAIVSVTHGTIQVEAIIWNITMSSIWQL